ncbi:protein AGENET DOMAIN (AGD)-CONTAINING P1-like [Nicotiana tomentosiformis]|uniref:protein AGENET DOMAIN (AGD)-CONTAINING P1-like n=1 Tax=Nicotiana tomentosiformis TaxID=4098 RepID=UPI00051B8439|nr:uncharacterized protein LOC104107104 [Nicotiana tomentosiformis]
MDFQKGDEVEVESGELGFIGSYYEATIISSIGTSRYKVNYKTLLAEDESELLEEIVTPSRVRPMPPHIANPVGDFNLYDGIDVFEFDYIIYFPTTDEKLKYPPDVLRTHQEWTYKGK